MRRISGGSVVAVKKSWRVNGTSLQMAIDIRDENPCIAAIGFVDDQQFDTSEKATRFRARNGSRAGGPAFE